MLSTTTGACLRIAAPVLEFGDEPASPRLNTFGYRTCCMVCLSMSTYPLASPVDSRARFDPVRRRLARYGVQHVVGQHGCRSRPGRRW